MRPHVELIQQAIFAGILLSFMAEQEEQCKDIYPMMKKMDLHQLK